MTGKLKALAKNADLVVAADSGVRHAAPLDVALDLIVGDFDSATTADLASYLEVPQKHHPVRKNQLDLELALTEATVRGATDLLVVGALGGRLDQTLAALLIAARYRETCKVTLHSGHTAAYSLKSDDASADDVRVLELPPRSDVQRP